MGSGESTTMRKFIACTNEGGLKSFGPSLREIRDTRPLDRESNIH